MPRLKGNERNHEENNLKKLACFWVPGNHQPADHVYHAIRHKPTTKTPQRNTEFPKTTLKNTSKPAAFSPPPVPDFF
jgi:hypothetical protein